MEETILKTEKELLIEEIQNAPDYTEEKIFSGEEMYYMIAKIIGKSEVMGKKIIQCFLYNENFGGAGCDFIVEDI